MNQDLRHKLDRLPEQPGIYVFKDADGKVIYVGKAENLRSRVWSYFAENPTDARPITRDARWVIADLDTVVTFEEKESFHVEDSFIKENKPRYNVRLKDDKDFLHLRVNLEAEWPRLELLRRPDVSKRNKNVKLFGPYHSARSARRTMLLASRHFRLRTCTNSTLRNRQRPCLLYQMNRCPGPCVYNVDPESYLEQVRHAALFLDGRHDELLADLETKMKSAAAELAFERAALYRDQLRAIQSTLSTQHVVQLADIDQDAFGVTREAGMIQVVVLQVRGGKLSGKREFNWKGFVLPVPLSELLSSLVAQYYEPELTIPDEILLPFDVENMDGLAELLSERRGKRASILVPKRGRKEKLLRLAQLNAEQTLSQRRRSSADTTDALEGIRRILGLEAPPKVIECIDIAHHGEGRAVAAVAGLVDGRPSKKRTRSFTIKYAKTGDDYGGMYEVLSRRFRRALENDEGWNLPDLLVVDGGRGQLAMAIAAREDLGFESSQLPIVGLAKERAARRGPAGETLSQATVERVYLPGRMNPIAIRGTSPLLLLCHARDEAHRLAGKLLDKHRSAKLRQSVLDKVPGIGPKTRVLLIKELRTVDAIKAASLEDLEKLPGIGPAMARKIHTYFNGPLSGSAE